MHLRLTTCIGMDIATEESDVLLGTLNGALIDPDTGEVVGFFVSTFGVLSAQTLFLPTFCIVRWGTSVWVSDEDALCHPQDILRVQALLDDPRTLLGQPVTTKSGVRLGTCKDVQFSTTLFQLEWVFPKTFWKWGTPVPATDILEVTPEAIIVREPLRGMPEETNEPVQERAREALSLPTPL